MNNIYDVILNFNKLYYEVYEWRDSDNIENIRKLPFFKVNNKDYVILKNKNARISLDTMNKLVKNCRLFDEKMLQIKCLVTNGVACMGIIIDKNRYIVARSSMLYDEEEEVIEESRDLREFSFVFDFIGENYNIISRLEYEKKQLLYNFINNTTDKMVLKYIYYDYYLEECDSLDKIKKDIIKEIDTCDYDDLFRLYDKVILFNDYVK